MINAKKLILIDDSLVRGTQSAFVDIGIGKNAILHAEKSDKAIAVGALLLVQVQREPPSRDKGCLFYTS